MARRTNANDQDDKTTSGFVRVRGAREHNLKNIDVSIPRNQLVVFSGVSGSGKSSLAFGTLYAEAQRRYLESVSPYARRLIDQVGVPDVDAIDGLPPAVALQQQRGTPNARSTVGSLTTLSSLVRMLYSRVGTYPPRQTMLYAEDFSFNTPQGACPRCHGMGRVHTMTEASMVPDPSLTIRQRAIAAWPTAWGGQNLRDILVSLGYDIDIPWKDLPKKDRQWILFTDEQPTVPVYAGLTPAQTRQAQRLKMEPSYQGTFSSAKRNLEHTLAHTDSAAMRKRVLQFMISSPCPVCQGKRLKPEALSVTFAGYDIADLSHLSLDQLADVIKPAANGEFAADRNSSTSLVSRQAAKAALDTRVQAGGSAHKGAPDVRRTDDLSPEKRIAAERLCGDLLDRLTTLIELGLGYLSLDRSTPTCSSGELQRLRLATQLSSQLFGVIYVLDEPTAGLHPADGHALFDALDRLKASGNSLFVVEHDVELMRRADWLVDVGPEAGSAGGRILYSGEPQGLRQVSESRTRPYLFEETARLAPPNRPPQGWLRLEGVRRNNLQGVTVSFPLGCFTAVTGVSGSGKSSLVSQSLLDLVAAHLGMRREEAEEDTLENTPTEKTIGQLGGNVKAIQRLIEVDQKPIGRTPRSNLATYTGLFDQVRKLFAATPEARRRHFDAGRFSFNVAKGRCPTCEGEGQVSIELLFMPSVYAPCPTCHGTRYNEKTLEINWNGKSIADVLGMTVEEACLFFAQEALVLRSLDTLRDIGLGYLKLGQSATELSGGEAQRIKLSTELQRTQRGTTLYVLDEPTTGLHPRDVDRLLVQLNRLVDAGNTVIVVEHDMRTVAQCDWVIDVGPGAGNHGGTIVAAGTPAEIAVCQASHTAPFLANILKPELSPP
ncbi:excinuclease ABC subunit UvrA [Spirosoma sp. KCTC 42546]|uniref:excinuclease ABC subunit UvrA n=1 Tax=Spirosoma sp. KCTC 42546 TaxID=2520506 RepID=UPI0011573451|nr:excinuclease ABC subunit UvrA [Spirosoma sp. KCTC 42546]QDK81139.1 excinuclease ABC subunit UvrA [Spirosoma sp. KCTC 42546]